MREENSPSDPLKGGDQIQAPLLWCLSLAVLFFFEFYLFFGVSDYIGGLRGAVIVPQLPFEKGFPFAALFSVLYFSLYPLMGLGFYFFRLKSELQAIYAVYSLELVLASAVFILIPTVVPSASYGAHGFSGWLYDLADIMNLQNNAFPSLHVAFAFTARDIGAIRSSRRVGFMLTGWAVLITLSTLFLHQHRLLDVWGGITLAYLMQYFLAQFPLGPIRDEQHSPIS